MTVPIIWQPDSLASLLSPEDRMPIDWLSNLTLHKSLTRDHRSKQFDEKIDLQSFQRADVNTHLAVILVCILFDSVQQ